MSACSFRAPSTVIVPRSHVWCRLSSRAASPLGSASAKYHRRAARSWVVGITGAPGSGKSTLTDRLVAALLDRRGHEQNGDRQNGEGQNDVGARVGVLAIDPTSPFTGGAILGDRVRMQEHATDPRVFIRSMATRWPPRRSVGVGTPGRRACSTPRGYDWVIVETVGVGQVEVEVAGHADTTVVVVNPGWATRSRRTRRV